jgi:hypothetical protein
VLAPGSFVVTPPVSLVKAFMVGVLEVRAEAELRAPPPRPAPAVSAPSSTSNHSKYRLRPSRIASTMLTTTRRLT